VAETREEWYRREAREWYAVASDTRNDRDERARAALSLMNLDTAYNEETGDELVRDLETAYTIACALADWARLNGLEAA
jgi:hypothetical protein